MKPRVGVVQFKAVCPEGNEYPLACGITYELARRLTCLGGVDANAFLLERGATSDPVFPGSSESATELPLSVDRSGGPDDPGAGVRSESDFIVTGRVHMGDGVLLFYRLYEAESGRLVRDGCVTGMRTAIFRLLDDLAQECRRAMGWTPGTLEDDVDFTPIQDSIDFEAFTEYCLGRQATKPRNAMSHLERALDREPGFRLALVEYLSTCYQVDEDANSHRTIDAYLAEFPDDQEILISAANICLAFGHVDPGTDYANRALEQRPDDVEPHVLLARFLFAREMSHAATAHLEAALHSTDETPEASYCLGRYFLDLGDYYRARDYFEKCLDTDPGYLVALRDLQCCYYELGDFQDGIEACEMLLDADPSDAGSNYNLGLIYQRLGRMHLGVKFFEEAIRQDPAFFKAIFMIGEYELGQGRPAEALRRFEQSHRAQPDSAEALGRIGDCHYRLGRTREAYRHYAWARREDPLFENARSFLIEGITFAEEGDIDAAEERLRRALDREEGLAEAWSELAWVLLLRDRPEEAWTAVGHAVDLEPDQPAFLANLIAAAGHLPLGLRWQSDVRTRVREARERLRYLEGRKDVDLSKTRRRARRLLRFLTWYGVRG